MYQKENRDFYRENHLCTICGKNAVYGDDKTCFDCRAKKEQRRKEPTAEQKERYRTNFRKNQNSLYRERVENGICTRCGKAKALTGKKKCWLCLEKDAELHRRKYYDKPNVREYRRENNLCCFCGEPIDREAGRICGKCWQNFHDKRVNRPSENKFWRKDNKNVFKNS